MITVIATVKAKPGKGPDLEADFRSYAETVKANEPGTLLYTLNRDPKDPETFYAIEIYQDEASLQTHLANFHARQGAPDVALGPPEIQVLERLV